MKHYLFLAVLLAFIAGRAQAAPIWHIKPIGQAADSVWSFFIDGDNLNGAFNAIEFKTWTYPQGRFGNNNSGASAGVPRPPGQQFTYMNRMLGADPVDFPGGYHLAISNLVNTPRELSFTATALNGTISTAAEPGDDLFLGNFYVPSFTVIPDSYYLFRIRLLTAGAAAYDSGPIYYQMGPITMDGPPQWIVPEPATAFLGSAAGIALGAVTRRRFKQVRSPCSA